MMRICVKDCSVHINRPFRMATRGQCLCGFQSIPGSPCLVTCLSWQLSWLEIKRRILRKAVNILHRQQRLAEETASWLEVSGGAGTSSSIVSHLYRLVSNCILWYIPARCMWLHTYPIFSYSSVKSNLKRLHLLQNLFYYSANHFNAPHLHSNVKKA